MKRRNDVYHIIRRSQRWRRGVRWCQLMVSTHDKRQMQLIQLYYRDKDVEEFLTTNFL